MSSVNLFHTHVHSNTTTDGNDDPTFAKATAMVVLFSCSVTLGCIPIKLNKWFIGKDQSSPKNTVLVKMLLAFGGGVLFCTTFMHLLPEVSESVENLNLTPDLEVPWAELLMCIGFLVMYFVEECVHNFLHRKEKQASLVTLERTLSIRRGENDEKRSSLPPQSKPEFESTKTEKPTSHHCHREDHQIKINTHHGHQDQHGHSHADHSHVIVLDNSSTVALIRGLLVVLGLSIHELFEGLAVGLESSSSHVWYMFGAVAAHKLVIAFCIGVELVISGLKTITVIIYVTIFAVVSPLGIGMGILFTNLDTDNADLVSVILQGMATGTLLYVLFFEILQEDRKSGFKQYFSLLVGFTVMFCLTIFAD